MGSNYAEPRTDYTYKGKDLKMSRKQIRARAKRAAKALELEEKLLEKPVSQWDLEELAKGRPKNKNGTFQGRPPAFLSRQLHEEITREFAAKAKGAMKLHAVRALEVLENILENDERTEDGKLVIPASTKVDVAKFVLEQILGKPTQRVEQDISIRLQGILASATATPAENVISSTVIEAQTGLKKKAQQQALIAAVPGKLTGSDLDDDDESYDNDD